MSSQREVFRDVVLARAEEIGLSSDARIVAAGGPSSSTLTKIRALSTDPRGDVLQRLDTALRWPAGSALRLWRDGVAPSAQGASSLEDFTDVELADELARRIRQREEVGNYDRSAPTSKPDTVRTHNVTVELNEGADVTQLPSAQALDPSLPDDIAARAEKQTSKTQRARERQDKETEGP